MSGTSRTFDIGTQRFTVFSSLPIEDSEAVEMFHKLQADALDRARVALAAGNSAALNEAIAIVQSSHKDEQRYPQWLVTAMADALARPEPARRRGRTGNAKAAQRARFIEAVRADHVQRSLADGLSKQQAFLRASQCLGGDVGGTPRVMEQSFGRFMRHFREAPHDYYPVDPYRPRFMPVEVRRGSPAALAGLKRALDQYDARQKARINRALNGKGIPPA